MTDTETKQTAAQAQNPNKSPYTVWLLVLSFAAPVALAYYVFFFVDIKSFSNHGEILDPIVHITDFELKDADGKLIPEKDLAFKWRMISFVGRDCDEACVKRLHDTRQIYLSLGKDRHRVLQMFIHLDPPGDSLQALIDAEHPQVIHAYGDEPTIAAVIGKNASLRNNITYIMDPMGNVMMRFTQYQPNRDFLTDLRKLLKASQIG